MITKWRLHNFKSIKRKTELEFGPLTIFAGANSTGKSTIIQSILLISQTLSHKVESRSVVLNGSLSKLGQFDDLRSDESDSEQITIAWECKPGDPKNVFGTNDTKYGVSYRFFHPKGIFLELARCQIAFDSDPSSPHRDVYQIRPRLFGCELEAVMRDQVGAEERSRILVSRSKQTSDQETKLRFVEEKSAESESTRLSLDFDVELDDRGMDELREYYISAEPVGCVLRHFLPQRLSIKIDTREEKARLLLDQMAKVANRPLPRFGPLSEEMIPRRILTKLAEELGKEYDEIEKRHAPVGCSPPKVEHNLRKDIAQIFSVPQESLFASTEDSGMSLREWQDRIRGAAPSLRLRAALRQALSEEATLREELLEVFREIWSQEFEIVQFRLPRGMMAVEEYLDFYFTNSVRYLGPLRDEPKALYPLGTPSDPMDVGVRGEFTAAVLDLYKSRPVRYIPASKFSGAQIAPTPTVRTLETAVTDWMNYLGVAETFRSKDRGKLGHELQVSLTPKGRYQDLTHVGVGVSQVLPILVGCLLAAKDSVVILEQPEIHLHPKVQTLLGDFFLAMALLGKQCIIETHSEYLINRLRLRAASAPLTRSLTAYMKIYFVEKTEGQSVFKEIEVNEFGAVTDWPEGFLDQSQREAEETLRAALRKKQELRTKEREKLGWPSE